MSTIGEYDSIIAKRASLKDKQGCNAGALPIASKQPSPTASAVLACLKAAGITGRKRRTKAAIKHDLSVAREVVRKLRRELKSAVMADTLVLRKSDPVFRARWKAGIQAGWSDPVIRAERVAKIRATWAKTGRLLPIMTADQLHRYRYQQQRIGRTRALAEIFGATQ